MNTDRIQERLDRIEKGVSSKWQEQWLTINGVAEYSSLSIAKIRRAVASGELKVSKGGGRLLFKIKWIDRWLLR